MDINALISNLGFPIAVCCYLMYFQNSTFREFQETLNNLRETVVLLKESIERMEEKYESSNSCGS